MDFRKGKVDIIAVKKFLSAMILGTQEEIDLFTQSGGSTEGKTNLASLSDFLSWLTSDSVEEDPEVVSHQLRSDPPILLSQEMCERVYRSGRDLFVYTNLRLLLIDVQGIMGKKVKYLSVPLKWVKTFVVETAGLLDRDAEVYIGTAITNKDCIEQDILVKRGDVMDMHLYLGSKLLFSE